MNQLWNVGSFVPMRSRRTRTSYKGRKTCWYKTSNIDGDKFKKLCFYIAQVSSPMDSSKRYPLADLFIPTPTQFLWEALSHVAHGAKDIHIHFHHCLYPGTHLYSWVNLGIVDRTKMSKFRNGSKWGIRSQALSIASPAFYHLLYYLLLNI